MNKNRPLSPHLQIYRLPFTAILSIFHRITGFLLYLFTILMAWIVILYNFIPSCIQKIFFLIGGCKLTILALFLITLMIIYHAVNGIRHLLWDIGIGLDLKNSNLSGVFTLIFSMFINLLIWNYVYF